jgi:hypothetical protein
MRLDATTSQMQINVARWALRHVNEDRLCFHLLEAQIHRSANGSRSMMRLRGNRDALPRREAKFEPAGQFYCQTSIHD